MDFDEEPLNGEGAEEGGAADISERRIVEASLPVSLLFARPRYSELVRAARGFIETYPENAVITAQVAVEVFVEMAFSRLLSEGDLPPPLAEAVYDLIPRTGFDLSRSQVQGLWTALTGDAVQQTGGLWSRYREHLQRRHRATHRGARVPVADARASVEVVTELITYMQDVLRPLFPDAPPEREEESN